jgi:1,4-alpha-glucan branching enzyme
VLGGLGVHVDEMARAMGGRVAMEVFVPRARGYRRGDPGVRLHEVDAPDVASHVESWIAFSEAAAALVERRAPDVDLVHCHDWSTALAGAILRQRLAVPMAVNVHLPQGHLARQRLEDRGLAAADLVIVNSRATAGELAARGLPLRRLEVVPNGVDRRRFRPPAEGDEDGGYVLFVGRLVAQKGVDWLLKAFAAVVRRLPEARLVVAGDGDLELYLQRVARYLGIPHRVDFRGWTTGAALVELYRRARLVVVPSYYEPFGIVALEAMACGRPVVASRVGGLAEVIEDGVGGRLVPAGDHLELARCLVALLGDPDLLRRMGEAARAHTARFTWEAAADRTLALYAEVTRRKERA